LTDRFLYIGIQNRLFFKHFGVSDNKLIFTPYCVDNDRFQNDAKKLLSKKNKLRTELGLPADSFIALFSGKFIAKKRPLDLLNAVSKIQNERVYAVFVGDGELRRDMENFIRENNLERRALLTGFVNQSVIPRYYAAADVFVMCSEKGETWGLSTNEAMNFSLPIILSDQLGCADDLVIEGKNGFKYSCGDTSDLAEKIEYLATIPEAQRHDMGVVSLKKVGAYSYSAIIAGLQKI
jgi:glycosyltransferase involved in cell wall biosynthesis